MLDQCEVRLTWRMHVDAHMWLTMKETIRTGTTIDYEEEDDGRGQGPWSCRQGHMKPNAEGSHNPRLAQWVSR
jgi:hypothetical protein